MDEDDDEEVQGKDDSMDDADFIFTDSHLNVETKKEEMSLFGSSVITDSKGKDRYISEPVDHQDLLN